MSNPARHGQVGRLAWRALAPFGAEVEHDFREPLTSEEAEAFRRLLFERRLLLMRGQSLSLAQQQDLVAHIGPVLRGERGMAYVAPDDGILNDARLAFHSDLAFAPEPFTALSLHAVDVEDGQTSTLFVDGVSALQTLDARLKAAVAGRQAIFVQPMQPDVRPMDRDEGPGHAMSRPIVFTHPTTHEPVLFVNEQHVARVEGLEPAESRALLTELFDQLYGGRHTFEHRWRNGDLILWDNIALQHGRNAIRGVARRRLQRASVAQRSLLEQMPDYFEARPPIGAAG
jgi:taurine dioxygenase